MRWVKKLLIGFIIGYQIKNEAYGAATYVILAIEIPLAYFLFKLFKSNDKKSYHNLSQTIKLIMLSGTLSIIVFTILY